jgi:tRNA-modifying protein YgfZ
MGDVPAATTGTAPGATPAPPDGGAGGGQEAAPYRSPLLALPGAVPADGVDAGVALHYGDPMGEQRVLATRVGFVDRSNRQVIRVTGEDRLTWLHSITSQHLSELPENRSAEALVLSPHGHVENHMYVTELGGQTFLDTEPGSGGPLMEYLDSMRFMLRVDPREVTDEWAFLSVVGPDVAAFVFRCCGIAEPPAPYGVVSMASGGWLWRMPYPGADAADLMVPRHLLPQVAERLVHEGARPAGVWAYEALRVEARQPRFGFETDHRTIPHEVGWIGVAVHLDKGCYRGQETVARVHNLGRPPRRMVLLHLDGSEETLPPHGAPVTLDGRQVGFVGTAVRHHELGPVALALVKRTVPDDAVLSAGRVAASIDTDSP